MSLQLELPFEPNRDNVSQGKELKPLTNIPWSYSRRSVLSQCPRRYYYEYYGSDLRTALNEKQKEKLHFLKTLSNRHERVGQILHLVVATYFRKANQGEYWTVERLCKWARQLFNKDVTYSQNARKEGNSSYGDYPPNLLTEFYYDNSLALDLCLNSESRMLTAIEAFATAQIYEPFRDISSYPESVIEYPMKISVDEIYKISGRIDLAFLTTKGASVVDWKLSGAASGDDSLQLISYSMWAQRYFNVIPSMIQIHIAHLESSNLVSEVMTDDAISRGHARILQDIELMMYLHNYGRQGLADAFTPCQQIAICSLCSFREVCVDGGTQ